MISRYEFPYLQSLVINNINAVKDLTVTVFEGSEFKHLILIGKNGSGKTTILRSLFSLINLDAATKQGASNRVRELKEQINERRSINSDAEKEIVFLSRVKPYYRTRLRPQSVFLANGEISVLLAFFEASRKPVQMRDVATVTTEKDLFAQIQQSLSSPTEYFKQHLVNRKVSQVFDLLDNKIENANSQADFFDKLESSLRKIFDDYKLRLEFERNDFEFFLVFSNGDRKTFNELSAGYAAFVNILSEIMLRADLWQHQAGEISPYGFVLIDEPETHLHLEMQYQILPLLTDLFPNLQFIVATHSPAIASSIKNATVFNLSARQAMGDEAAGSSYSELMQGLFGVENEYSNVADEIITDIKRIAKLPDHAQARRELLDLLAEKGRYMSPVLRLEVEAQLIGLD